MAPEVARRAKRAPQKNCWALGLPEAALTSQCEGYNFIEGSKAGVAEKSGVHLMRRGQPRAYTAGKCEQIICKLWRSPVRACITWRRATPLRAWRDVTGAASPAQAHCETWRRGG